MAYVLPRLFWQTTRLFRQETRTRREKRCSLFCITTIPQGLIAELSVRKVGRNGLIVMLALCRKVYDDGRLGRASALSIAEFTGLGLRQVERGMADLKERGIIEPVRFKDDEGRWRFDRSCGGHVAQHRIAKEIWDNVQLPTACPPFAIATASWCSTAAGSSNTAPMTSS